MKNWHDIMAARAIQDKKRELMELIGSLTKDGVHRPEILSILSEEFYDIYETASNLLSESLSDQLEDFLNEVSPEPEVEKQIIHILLEEAFGDMFCCVFASFSLKKVEDELHRLREIDNGAYYSIQSKEVEE